MRRDIRWTALPTEVCPCLLQVSPPHPAVKTWHSTHVKLARKPVLLQFDWYRRRCGWEEAHWHWFLGLQAMSRGSICKDLVWWIISIKIKHLMKCNFVVSTWTDLWHLFYIRNSRDLWFFFAMSFEGKTSSMLFTYALLYQRDNISFSDLVSHCAFACSKLLHGLHFGVCSCFLQLVMPHVPILDVPMLQAQEGKPNKTAI